MKLNFFNKMKINFFQADNSNWGNLQADLSKAIREYLNCGKDFEVEFSEVKASKSWQQIKAIHRLCQLLAPRFSESYGTEFDMEGAKLAVKLKLGYLRPLTMREAISEALFVKSQMEATGQKIDKRAWSDILQKTFNDKTPRKPKSFADATKEEMMGLIQGIEELGNTMGWKELKLTSAELQGLVEYYNKKEQ